MIQRAKDLKEEKSQSLSTSVDFYHRFKNGIQTNFLIEGFYTSLSDVFVLEDIGKDEQGNIIKERRNGSGAKVDVYKRQGIDFLRCISPFDSY